MNYGITVFASLTNIGIIVLTGYAIYITESAWAGLLLLFLISVKSRNDDDKNEG